MASVYWSTNSWVDYSSVTGEVREFYIDGKPLRDKEKNIDEPGWREKLVELVLKFEWNIDKGHGIRRFVWLLDDDGLLIAL